MTIAIQAHDKYSPRIHKLYSFIMVLKLPFKVSLGFLLFLILRNPLFTHHGFSLYGLNVSGSKMSSAGDAAASFAFASSTSTFRKNRLDNHKVFQHTDLFYRSHITMIETLHLIQECSLEITWYNCHKFLHSPHLFTLWTDVLVKT